MTDFTEGNEEPIPATLPIDRAVEERQRARLARVRAERDGVGVQAALATLGSAAADPARNLMPPLIDAVGAHASVGELVAVLGASSGPVSSGSSCEPDPVDTGGAGQSSAWTGTTAA